MAIYNGEDLSRMNRQQFAEFISRNPQYLQNIGIDPFPKITISGNPNAYGEGVLYHLLTRRQDMRAMNNNTYRTPSSTPRIGYDQHFEEVIRRIGAEGNPIDTLSPTELPGVSYKHGEDWRRFHFNTDAVPGNAVKGYISLNDVHALTPNQLEQFLRTVNDDGFSGRVKFHRTGGVSSKKFDNIVIHAENQAEVEKAMNRAQSIFRGNIHSVDYGRDIGGKSHTQLLAQNLFEALKNNQPFNASGETLETMKSTPSSPRMSAMGNTQSSSTKFIPEHHTELQKPIPNEMSVPGNPSRWYRHPMMYGGAALLGLAGIGGAYLMNRNKQKQNMQQQAEVEFEEMMKVANVMYNGVDLTQLDREAYVNFIKNNPAYLQQIGVSNHPDALYGLLTRRRDARMMNDQEWKNLLQQHVARKNDANAYGQTFNRFINNLGVNPNDIKANTNIPGVQYRMGEGWSHFVINPSGAKADSIKGYVSLNDAHSLTEAQLQQFLNETTKGGYRGQIKFHPTGTAAGGKFDNIVIHGDTQADIDLAMKHAKNVFGKNILSTEFGKDGIGADGKKTSHTVLLSQDLSSYLKNPPQQPAPQQPAPQQPALSKKPWFKNPKVYGAAALAGAVGAGGAYMWNRNKQKQNMQQQAEVEFEEMMKVANDARTYDEALLAATGGALGGAAIGIGTGHYLGTQAGQRATELFLNQKDAQLNQLHQEVDMLDDRIHQTAYDVVAPSQLKKAQQNLYDLQQRLLAARRSINSRPHYIAILERRLREAERIVRQETNRLHTQEKALRTLGKTRSGAANELHQVRMNHIANAYDQGHNVYSKYLKGFGYGGVGAGALAGLAGYGMYKHLTSL